MTNYPTLRTLAESIPLAERIRLLFGASDWTLHPAPEVGLDVLTVSDGPVGVRGTALDDKQVAYLAPSPTLLAASFDPDLVRRVAAVLAEQARSQGIGVLLAPTMNLHRSPLGGRHFENYSEDPLLVAQIARGYIEGVQSMGIAACAKHFVGNESETERTIVDSVIDDKTLRDIYLWPFEVAVRDAGVLTVMAAYNKVNGSSMTSNQPLLTTLLREDWGFDGLVMSDWGATYDPVAAVAAGTDLTMPGPADDLVTALTRSIKDHTTTEDLITERAARILQLAERTGVLASGADGTGEPARTTPTAPDAADPERLLRTAATRGIVMLRNESALPLDRPQRVALIGQGATALAAQGGGSAHITPRRVVQLDAALRAALPKASITTAVGTRPAQLLPEFSPGLASAGDEPGIRLEFLDEAGAVLSAHTRPRSKFVTNLNRRPPASRTLRIVTELHPTIGGTHQISVAGAGHYRLSVNGRTERFELHRSGDPAAQERELPQRIVTRDAAAAEPISLTVNRELAPDEDWVGVRLGYLPPEPANDELMEQAVTLAGSSDVAIVVVGTGDEVESEGFDRVGLTLPGRQDELVSRVAAAAPKTVVIVNAGSPVEMPWRDEVDAILVAFFPGQEGGQALADILVGEAEPGGRLPTTWPARLADAPVTQVVPDDHTIVYSERNLIGYRAYRAAGIRPAFGFGFGLGYTTWRLDNAKLHKPTAHSPRGTGPAVQIMATNTGERSGRQVYGAYLVPGEDADRALDPDPIRLAGFVGIKAAAGEQTTARIELDPRALERWDVATGQFRPIRGNYQILIAPHVDAPGLVVDWEA